MKAADSFPEIYLYRHPCDMRKQIHGLSTLVHSELAAQVFSDKKLYVFCNRRRNLLKCIYWDHSGFAMWVKQLEEEKFAWPRKLKDDVITVTPQEFKWLLQGINLWKIKKHKSLDYTRIY